MMTFDNPLSSDEQRLALIIFQTLERAMQTESLLEKMRLLDEIYVTTSSEFNAKLLTNLILKV